MLGEMKDMMKQAHSMRKEIKKTQKELAKRTFEEVVGGGAIKITMNGNMEVVNVVVSADLLSKDPSVVQRLMQTAINAVIKRVQKGTASDYKDIAKGLGGGGLGGMLGG